MKYTSSELIGNGWNLYQKNFSEWFLFALKWLLPIPIITELLSSFIGINGGVSLALVMMILAWINVVITIYVVATLTVHAYNQFKGYSSTFIEATDRAKSKIIPLILLGILAVIGIILISIPLVMILASWIISQLESILFSSSAGFGAPSFRIFDYLPSLGTGVFGVIVWLMILIYFGVRFTLSTPILTMQRVGVIESLQKSWRLSKGRWTHIFVTLLIMGLISIGVQIAVVLISFIPFLGAIVDSIISAVISAFLVPFSAAVTSSLYMNVVGEDDEGTHWQDSMELI